MKKICRYNVEIVVILSLYIILSFFLTRDIVIPEKNGFTTSKLEFNDPEVVDTEFFDVIYPMIYASNIKKVVLNIEGIKTGEYYGRIQYKTEEDTYWQSVREFKLKNGRNTVYSNNMENIKEVRLVIYEPDAAEIYTITSATIYKTSYFIFVIAGILLMVAVLMYVVKKRYVDKIPDSVKKAMKYVAVFVVHGLIVYCGAWMIESAYGNNMFYLSAIHRITTVAILLFIWLFLLFLTNSTKAADIIYLFFTAGYGMVNAVVSNIRGVPIQPQDMYAISAAQNVVSQYEISCTFFMKRVIFAFILLLIISCCLKTYKIQKVRTRIVLSSVAVVSFAVVLICFFTGDGIMNKLKLYRDEWSVRTYYNDQGVVLSLLTDAKAMIEKAPEGYSERKVQEELEQFNSIDDETAESEDLPNVIVIMNESFADFRRVGDFEVNEEYMPYLDSMSENTIKGIMYSSVWGGRTADVEYEFLTGATTAFLSNMGYSYINGMTDSLVTNMSKLGYKTIGIHPFGADGYNRATIYEKLQFDEKYFIENFPNDNIEYLRCGVSDKCDYDTLIKLYENKQDDKLFIFNITIQNHGGYKEGLTGIWVQGVDDIQETNEYLTCIKYSDTAFGELIDYFSKEDEKTIILMFGDHQPAIEQSFYDYLFGKGEEDLTLEEMQKIYIVPFVIWANYDIEEKTEEVISANYLASYLMDVAGLKMSAYNRYLLNLHESITAINKLGYIGTDGIFYSFEDESPYSEMINNYRIIQYNLVNSKKKQSQYFNVK